MRRLTGLGGALWLAALASTALAQTPVAGPADGVTSPPTNAVTNAITNAPTVRPDAPPELAQALPRAVFVGKARLTVWGFDVYDARLWTVPGQSAARYASAPLALELAYLRDFKAADIADRSLQEMRRSQAIVDADAARWKAELLRVLPDVRKGDRILGVHRPGAGASFWVNGRLRGESQDVDFARLFFGIWLSPGTSEPKMREALLTRTGE